MIYDIRLTIAHRYQQAAGPSRTLIRVLPRVVPFQQSLTASLLEVEPLSADRSEGVDFFGNTTTAVAHFAAHGAMTIRLSCRVDRTGPAGLIDLSPDLPSLTRELQERSDLGPDSPLHFMGPSPRLSPNSEIARFAVEQTDPAASVASIVVALGRALHGAITFDPKATTVDTNPVDAFRQRRGVCQDISHIMILALRALGVPAGYVSGYLRTLPPKGGVRLEGADAMHAWVRAWCGAGQGWLEYDPTNATLVGNDHIVVGYGRDYADVSPVIGSLRASGAQVSTQSVDVISVG